MSSGTTGAINPAFPPPPPEGLAYLAAIRPSLNLLMIGTVFTSLLVPIAVALFVFSTPSLRRKPIFILNVIAVLLGIAEGILNGYLEITAIISPHIVIHPTAYTAFTCLCLLVPLFSECILLLRLVAVYPLRQTSRSMLVVVFAPPVIFKIVRLVNIGIFLGQWVKQLGTAGSPIAAGQATWGQQPWTKIEWFLQLADNIYASVLFLIRLNSGRGLATASTVSKADSYAARLKALFWIAISNFVFPVLLSLAQLIFAFRDSSYLDGGYIFLTNNYVEIIGVLMATVWVAGSHWSDGGSTASSYPKSSNQSMSAPQFYIPSRPSRATDRTFGSTVTSEVGYIDSEMSLDRLRAKAARV
ncbi:hypothetical protein E1B28_007564 [Marasmius oreades]|uniref:Uncharacterized protein n=1 Tax=Marasmius oreades TaxID=181124 RepID=A0A9P7S1Z5_9AGAR|nr:uncharacterized protein E1B28_007564 [Marasmius oreades]KAG7093929.1 hypothetical protein E1B28_007564 [Marasmius oreades]